MGKNHRHKKTLKSEKAKTHIKSKTKFLPKGQNVTNTSFKIRPIVLQEQLKEKDQNQLLSKRKLTVNELLTKLKHYNENVKSEACHELQEMFKQNSFEILQKHLAAIIQTSSTLIQDREKKVRRACVKLINEILDNIEIHKLVPFFNYISTNLRCAMTNIDKNIQEDSILLLDCLLEHVPSLIAENSEKIFPDFLTLISKLRNDSGLERTLTLNLGSKITSVKWRIKVLSRLYAVLKAMIDYQKEKDVLGGENQENGIMIQETSGKNLFPIYKPEEIYSNPFNFFTSSAKSQTGFINNHLSTLIPLLYETWLEVVPEKTLLKKTGGEATLLNEESATILSSIVNIVHLLHEHVNSLGISGEIFAGKDTEKFLNHLLSHFPYGQGSRKTPKEMVKDFSKLFAMNDDPKCVEENLLIAYLFFILKINLNQKHSRNHVASLLAYINKCLTHANMVKEENLRVLILILREILFENAQIWRKYGVKHGEIIENLVKFHEESHLSSWEKSEVLELLTRANFSNNNENLNVWLGNLPSQLCKKRVSSRLVDIILSLCQKNHKLVQEGVRKSLQNILENVKNVAIVDESNSEEIKRKIFYTFFYIPQLTHEEIKLISKHAIFCNFPNVARLFQ